MRLSMCPTTRSEVVKKPKPSVYMTAPGFSASRLPTTKFKWTDLELEQEPSGSYVLVGKDTSSHFSVLTNGETITFYLEKKTRLREIHFLNTLTEFQIIQYRHRMEFLIKELNRQK